MSIFGDDRGREVALSGLKAKAKYVRGQLGRRMKLRITPEIRFIEDESLERGSRVRIQICLVMFIRVICFSPFMSFVGLILFYSDISQLHP